jgi:DNA-directed RNA polymerase beta' subunit
MIRLKDILKELSISSFVQEIGYLWPFAEIEEEAENWENSRLKNIFKGSLKDWSPHPTHPKKTIMYKHHIHQAKEPRAAVASDVIKIDKNYTFIKNIYDKNNVDLYLNAKEQPDPEKKY